MRNSNHGGYLLLEDGTRFDGDLLIGSSSALGEAVFNTSHSGYQEILTDPSYHRQIMVFTAPHIGNVGINREDAESDLIHVAGAVVRSISEKPRNWRSEQDLASWLTERKKPLLSGANTRAITLYLRNHGAMRAGLFDEKVPTSEALEMILRSPEMSNADLASEVTCKTQYQFSRDELSEEWHMSRLNGEGLKVAVLDYGVKKNILRELVRRGCEVTVFPGTTSADELINGGFDGVLLSNGPGDPAAVTYGIETIRNLIGKLPLFGICLGHQLLSLAAGMETYKLPFGHRGSNHPVRCEASNFVEITSQNHGFAVSSDNVPSDWKISHINLNDDSVEGLEHTELPIFSIQYHPEASPGPHEGTGYFDRFIREMRHA